MWNNYSLSLSPALSSRLKSASLENNKDISDNKSLKSDDEEEYIGFATLPEQVHRKAVKRGFDFTLMVLGETGLGKSTLINCLFLTELYKDRQINNVEDRIHKTTQIEKKQLEIEERGVRLRLTIVDTPGFNDSVNGEETHKPIIDYINSQFDQYFQDECGLNRKNIQDNRVHCCLYFISPFGHGLKPVDIDIMKKIHHKVNIVPLLAKADILTPSEVKQRKKKILDEIQKHEIQIYEFPECDSDEDEDFKKQDQELKKSVPFAVVGCNSVVEVNGKRLRGRVYPWGIVEVDNPNHCDFIRLRQMLISTHMQDLKDVTADVHYENYRADYLADQMKNTNKERKYVRSPNHRPSMRSSKLKRDSTPNFDAVMDTENLLQQKEAEIQRMQAMLAKMQAQLETQNNNNNNNNNNNSSSNNGNGKHINGQG